MKTILFAVTLAATATVAIAQDAETVTVGFVDAAGKDNGTAQLTATPRGLLIELEITGLPSGQWVAFHVHETGSCDHNSGHESAGGHFNPGGKEHGFLSEHGSHAGDMPNQYVGADGILRAQVFNDQVELNRGKTGILGRALMIHAQADDYQSQPSGSAGKRLACGVID
ncbi:superoxide dismutase family protein [Mesorhizobium sp. YC-39]|uniref:superoxide dismutase family protein n=1 Tax=unclassified Mesorhizobium TaxID=325217 RepID=UPI0021E90EA5|nr:MULTISPECIES: superoxide dismutase family protein [unclassified Mesorhizobium]MCV3210162.1 superoxide dismutase family protein [Mesorhizobium sp. YC-2]MCV3230692.1 superoxide dismutase family protein [Mesorhizobium sp. YC-39]